MRRWVFGSLAVLLAVGMLLPAGTFQPAWANSELHFGARLVYPLWDVRGSRSTFIVVAREALTVGNAIRNVATGTANVTWTNIDDFDNCRPRGNGFGSAHPFPSGIGNTGNVNRGSISAPRFDDDVHFEYYGKSCAVGDEIVHMSCADVDLFVLDDANPRRGFNSVAFDGVGALDVNLIINGSTNAARDRKDENSLMGQAIIADVAEGWAAIYPAAAAKSTTCLLCNALDGGTNVGYEAYPMEVFIPGVIADGFGAPGGKLSNLLALFSPNLFPGEALNPTEFCVDIVIWDGRERPFPASTCGHTIYRTLGNPIQSGQDQPTSIKTDFNVANFVCDHTTLSLFENDGFPRTGADASNCVPLSVADPTHTSDNQETGDQLQSSTPLATWRFKLNRTGSLPNFPANFGVVTDNSGRGLVGVVLAAVTGTTAASAPAFVGVGETIRLWHKDPCQVSQSGNNFGPIHLRDASLFILDAVAGPIHGVGGSAMTIFNALSLANQAQLCDLPDLIKDLNPAGDAFTNTPTAVTNFLNALTQ